MTEHLDAFNEDPREIMAAIDARLVSLRTLIDDAMARSEQEIGQHLKDMARHLEERRIKHEAARAELARSAERESAEPADKTAEWTRARDTSRLHLRADRLERAAAAAMYIAATAVEEAAQACLAALLARRQAIAIQIQRADEP